MTPSERTGLQWLWLQKNGQTTKEIATAVGRSVRLIQLYTQQARAWLSRRREKIEIVMSGVGSVCAHGLPILTIDSKSTWVCADCAATNHPEHPAFQRGDPIGGVATSEHQPKGKPKSRLASPSEQPNLKRRARKRSR